MLELKFDIEIFAIAAQKMKFSIKDLVTFTEEILNGKLHFLFSDCENFNIKKR